jgi:hypothetical protein
MRWKKDPLSDAIRELAKADVVAFGGVGLVGRILPVTEAYQAVADAIAQDPEKVRPELDRLLANASPAGKVYAATLLDQLDPAAGRAAWRSLAGENGEFTTFQGCIMNRTTLAEYAGARTGA